MSRCDISFDWAVKIPLRDGVLVNATVYRSCVARSAVTPCIVAITPYISDECHDRGIYFAARGYSFVVVDVRGRGNSEGAFRPFAQEASDGYDIVEWLARQIYCNGQVGMWGGSYSGYGQWAVAKTSPPHLSTIVPAGAAYPGIDFPMRSNIFQPFMLRWIAFTSGRAAQTKIFTDDEWWSSAYRRWHESGRPFRDLDAMLGTRSSIFQEWLDHPEPDAYWDSHNPTREEYQRMTLPILTITGIYDDDQPGALEHYTSHIRNASSEEHHNHYLVIGPWDHSGTRTPKSTAGGIEFGRDSVVDLNELHLAWYRWTMEGKAIPSFLKDRVAYYITGAERWAYAPSLDAVSCASRFLFLDSDVSASTDHFTGILQNGHGKAPPDTYRYDPNRTGRSVLDAEERVSGGSLIDQTVLRALGPVALVYESARFDHDMEISGFFRLRVWLSIDCPDTDFFVSVHEILPSGTSIRLSTDAMRARYRNGLRRPELVSTTAPLPYDFGRFTFMSRELRRGSRLRLVVAPIGRIMEATFAEKNYNGGGVVASESAESARPVTVRLHHDARHPSVLYVPLGGCADIARPVLSKELACEELS